MVVMSNLKRKDAPGGHPPSKSAKKSKAARPTKTDALSKKDAKPAASKAPKEADESDDKRPKAPVVSLLKDEEPVFPRGGGSVLTPLEQKQIQLEAKADALRDDEFDAGAKAQQKKKRKLEFKSDKKTPITKDGDDAIWVESLNFKVRVLGEPSNGP